MHLDVIIGIDARNLLRRERNRIPIDLGPRISPIKGVFPSDTRTLERLRQNEFIRVRAIEREGGETIVHNAEQSVCNGVYLLGLDGLRAVRTGGVLQRRLHEHHEPRLDGRIGDPGTEAARKVVHRQRMILHIGGALLGKIIQIILRGTGTAVQRDVDEAVPHVQVDMLLLIGVIVDLHELIPVVAIDLRQGHQHVCLFELVILVLGFLGQEQVRGGLDAAAVGHVRATGTPTIGHIGRRRIRPTIGGNAVGQLPSIPAAAGIVHINVCAVAGLTDRPGGIPPYAVDVRTRLGKTTAHGALFEHYPKLRTTGFIGEIILGQVILRVPLGIICRRIILRAAV